MFENDFEKLLIEYRDAINTRSRFVGLVKDYFPGQQKQVNLILSAYDLGISKDLETVANINNAFAYRFVKRMVEEYGISRVNADWAISLWCVCYGQNVLRKKCEIKLNSGKTGTAPSIQEEKTGLKQYGELFQYGSSSTGSGLAVTGFTGENNRTVIFQNTYSNKPVVEITEGSFSESIIEEAILTEGFTKIGRRAFYGCAKLKEIILPVSLKEIGDYAFAGCGSVKSITLHPFLTQIGAYSFAGTALKSVKIPKSVYWIGEGAFSECNNIDNIRIEDNINELPLRLFKGCSNLTKVKLHEQLTGIGDEVFADCINLSAIYIPESVTHIGENAFSGVNEKFILSCSYGSYAESYARDKKIKYQLV